MKEKEEVSLSSDKIVGLEYNKEGQCNEWIGSQTLINALQVQHLQ